MMENQPPLTSPDGSSNGNPPERCPRPLYSMDSTQEGQTISYKGINQSECNNAVKEEIKEEEAEVGVMEFSEGHIDPLKGVAMDPFIDTNPPEGCPRPLHSQDSTQEDGISHKSECNNAVKEEIKDEEAEVGVMKFSEGHKDPFKDVTMETFSDSNPPKRGPLPLYPRDSAQEDGISHKSINQSECNNAVKEELKEENEVGVMEFSEGHKDPFKDVTMETFSDSNPPERGPLPLFPRDSTQEDHTIPHPHQGEERIDIKAEVKEVETCVGGDQPSTEEVGMNINSEKDEAPLPINRNGCDARNSSERHLLLSADCNSEDNVITQDPPGGNPNTQNIHHRPSCPETSMDPSDQGESFHQSHTMIAYIHLGSYTADRSTDPSNPEESSPPHEGLHREGNLFSCSECGKSFANKGNLVQHQKIHTGTNQLGSKQNPPNLQMKENSVLSLQKLPFTKRSKEEKERIKELGPDRPNLKIQQHSCDRGRAYIRCFSSTSYEKWSWLAGCEESQAYYCFPCLLFQSSGTETLWTKTGVCDLKHLSEKCKRHESTRSHLENIMELQFFGKCSIAKQLDEGYRIGVKRHNEVVTKNRHILSRLIDCVKFCGALELALCDHDESESSDNPGIFHGLVDFVASIDGVLKEQLENSTVFKGALKTVQKELLDCMLSVVREHIIQEARSSDFISIQIDKTPDVATQCQLVLVLRYIDAKNHVQERFFEIIPLQSTTADSIAAALQERLAVILPEDQKRKLISQAYDGASVMTVAGVQKKIQNVYRNAHYIHSYAHPPNLIIQQATSHLPKVRIFFSDLEGLASFFSRSPKCTGVLDKVVARRLPTSSSVQWNFQSRAVNIVFEHREDLIRCFQTIEDSVDFDPATVREAGALARLLEDQDFKFFLQLFYNIMPHVDHLYAKLQRKDIDSSYIKESIQQFQQHLPKIRNALHSLVDLSIEGSFQPKRRCLSNPEGHKLIAAEVCDTILKHTVERFSFTDHLVSATLLRVNRFAQYSKGAFPEDALSKTLKAYPMLIASRLKTELRLIYSKEEFRTCRGAVDLLQLFTENNLEEVFVETVTLLKILLTTPMTTAEAERCFSTLKRIKTFLRNSMSQERLNALAMLSVEKRLVAEMTDFNQKVIEKFANQKERRETFLFK